MSEDLTTQYDLRGVETKEDLLEYLEGRVDGIMDDHGIWDDDSDVEYSLAGLVLDLLEQRGRMTRCSVCEQLYVPRLNPDGCPYTERSEHEENTEEDDDE